MSPFHYYSTHSAGNKRLLRKGRYSQDLGLQCCRDVINSPEVQTDPNAFKERALGLAGRFWMFSKTGMKQKHLDILHLHCSGNGLSFPKAQHAFHPDSRCASQRGHFIYSSSFALPTRCCECYYPPIPALTSGQLSWLEKAEEFSCEHHHQQIRQYSNIQFRCADEQLWEVSFSAGTAGAKRGCVTTS